MVDIIDGLMGDAMFLLESAIVLMAIIFVISTWSRTRSMMPTIGALVFGVFVIWGVWNIDILQQEVEEDIERHRDGGLFDDEQDPQGWTGP